MGVFNLLTDKLPKTVTIDGETHDIRWKYQHVITIERALSDLSIEQSERALYSMTLFYPGGIPESVKSAYEAMTRFISSDKPLNRTQMAAAKRLKGAPAAFSYDIDDEYIYAAFVQMYGIHLTREKDMHWFEFKALLNGLDECPFSRIRDYRSAELNKIEDKTMRKLYAEKKAFWALPESKAQQQHIDSFEDALMNGGDISALIAGRRQEDD